MTGSQTKIPREKTPQHVAIIMDGNGRWAAKRGLPRLEGHRAGTENLRRVIRAAVELNIRYLTFYAFSTENWGRPKSEVQGLMRILEDVIDRELDELHKEGVQIHHIGRLEGLNPTLCKKIQSAIELTKNNNRLILSIALNYGGRDEIVHAVQQLIKDNIKAEDVSVEIINQYLFTKDIPDPDLIVRTSGELRLSNFLIWQAAYAEFYVTQVYWPDFDKAELEKAIQAFSQRDRRYGGLSQTRPDAGADAA
jgi:undecaprenyl diphosphate synthase